MLLSGRPLRHVSLMTPKGIELDLLLQCLLPDLGEEELMNMMEGSEAPLSDELRQEYDFHKARKNPYITPPASPGSNS